MEPSVPKQRRISPLSILAAIFASLSFSLIFFSTYGPLSGSLIPFQPMGWAGMFVFLAMLCTYSNRYKQTKDNFWFILILMFFPVLLSDLYFFPITPFYGIGMIEWMGCQGIVSLVCFALVSKVTALKYANLILLLPIFILYSAYLFHTLSGGSVFLSPAIYILGSYAFGVIITATLSYYAYKQKEYFLIAGAFLNFLVSMPIPVFYIVAGYIPFGWNHEMMAVVTDRIAIFGRILMVASWPALAAFWATTRKTLVGKTQ